MSLISGLITCCSYSYYRLHLSIGFEVFVISATYLSIDYKVCSYYYCSYHSDSYIYT